MTLDEKIDAARAAGTDAARAAAPRLPALHDDLLDLLAGVPFTGECSTESEAIIGAWLQAYDRTVGLLQ